MPLIRKRRAQTEASPSPPSTRRRQSPSPSSAASVDEDIDGETQLDGDTQGSSHDQMVKKFVRLALASEYSRQPIRRSDISTKVLTPHSGRQFKTVFASTQDVLRASFGMELTPLPLKEKVTISQKRAAQRTQQSSTGRGSSTATTSYTLTSTLPASLRTPSILPPTRVATDSAYTALYTFIISIIYLSDGIISESKLERALKRVNADNHVLNGEKTEKVLKRMEKENYIVKVKESEGGGEQRIEYHIGPRGRVEVGERGVAGLVRGVYGKKDIEADELERKLVRSLGDACLERKKERRIEVQADEGGEGQERRRNSGRSRGQGGGVGEEEEEEEEEDEEEAEAESDDA